jgi:hypothetical protein
MRGLYFKNIFMVNNLIHKVYQRGKATRVFKYYMNKTK